mmetsp:Transcript_15690/g.45302  ORF Transcript_15690/g.45302 Transcript_15690/m.45302 type:complete len:123 (+) Transcript_15690:160-528(+)
MFYKETNELEAGCTVTIRMHLRRFLSCISSSRSNDLRRKFPRLLRRNSSRVLPIHIVLVRSIINQGRKFVPSAKQRRYPLLDHVNVFYLEKPPLIQVHDELLESSWQASRAATPRTQESAEG